MLSQILPVTMVPPLMHMQQPRVSGQVLHHGHQQSTAFGRTSLSLVGVGSLAALTSPCLMLSRQPQLHTTKQRRKMFQLPDGIMLRCKTQALSFAYHHSRNQSLFSLLIVVPIQLQVFGAGMPKGLSGIGTDVRPLHDSSLANIQDDALFHADHGFNLTPPLPAGLFTPPKPPKNPFAQHSNHLAPSPAAQMPSHGMQYSLFDQSRNRVSFSTTSTPTSIFRRLKTSSPEDVAEQHSQCKFDSFAYTQNINPNGATFAHAPSGLCYMAPVPQKRSRPVQRGIHPAEINKRITGASDSWQILDIVNTFGAEFDAVNVATALHRIAKQRPEDVMRLTNSDAFKQLVIMVDVQVRHPSTCQ